MNDDRPSQAPEPPHEQPMAGEPRAESRDADQPPGKPSHADAPPAEPLGADQPAEPPPTAEEPPPLTAFAWRNGLVRPSQGRMLAGVCGALSRATNTDPVLWRVVFAVLSIFGGIGVLAYLLGWLLLPADGDTASPVEALLWRGRSATSTLMTVVGAIVVLLTFGVFFSEPFRPGPFGILLLAGAVLLLLRDRRGQARSAGPPAPAGAATSWSTPTLAAASPPPAAQAAAPFAPRGPFASTAPPSGPPYERPYEQVARAPRPPRPKSRLGGLTLSMTLLVIGALGVVDLVGFSVPAAGYIAAALSIIGLGLIVGAWYGRARGLIALGIVVSIVLGLAGLFTHARDDRWWRDGGSVTFAPASINELRDSYRQSAGDLRLDLSAIDLSTVDQPTLIDARLGAGHLEIVVPPEADVTINAKVNLGDADVFGQSWNGIGLPARTVKDLGSGGPGGGELNINANVDLGSLEVHR